MITKQKHNFTFTADRKQEQMEKIIEAIEFVKENEVSDFNDIFYPIVNLNNLNTNNQDVFSDDLKKYIKKGLKVIIFHLNECFHEDDIESLSVLKGGAATALYGSRGANGVIIITTKYGIQKYFWCYLR